MGEGLHPPASKKPTGFEVCTRSPKSFRNVSPSLKSGYPASSSSSQRRELERSLERLRDLAASRDVSGALPKRILAERLAKVPISDRQALPTEPLPPHAVPDSLLFVPSSTPSARYPSRPAPHPGPLPGP